MSRSFKMDLFFQGFEKQAEDPSWWDKQKGVDRAMRAGDKGLDKVLVSDELVGGRMKKGLGHGLVGAGGGALAGGAGGALAAGPRGALAGAAGGALLGTILGRAHGQYSADKDYLGKRGIKPKYLGMSADFDDKAKKKYIIDPARDELKRLER